MTAFDAIRSCAIAALLVGCGRIAFDPLGGGTASDTYSAAMLADGPIAYWRLADPDSIARDEIGGLDGTYRGGCTHEVAGALASTNTAAAFDGTSCRIEVGTVLDLAGSTPFTIELWANLAVVSSDVRWLVSHNTETSPHSGYSLAFQTNNLWFEQTNGPTTLVYIQTATPSPNTFHHIAVTSNGQHQRLYVDGAMGAQQTVTPVQPGGTGVLQFGDYLMADPYKFRGTLDEIAFYDRELDSATLARHIAAR